MQAETGPTCIAARREEGIECLASDLRTHAAAIIRKDNFDVVPVELPSLDINCPRSTVGERVSGRIEKQIGKYLTASFRGVILSGQTIILKGRIGLWS